MSETVYCPVIKDQVGGTLCLEICVVADGEIKPSVLAPDIIWSEELKKMCLNCNYHADIDYEF